VRVITDIPLCTALVEELLQLISNEGGYVNKHLELVVDSRGNFTFTYSKKPKLGDKLISLPINCMPIMSDFSFELDGETLVAMPKQKALISPLHVKGMEIAVALYNLFAKVESYSKVAPPVCFRNDIDLCHTLLKAVNMEVMSLEYLPQLSDLKVVSFLHTRIYNDVETGTDRLIPFLEFVDHHSLAEGFHAGRTELGKRNVEIFFQPVENNVGRGVFISYSLMDALESFVKYGFVDKSAFFVKSQPFYITLPVIGQIKVDNKDVKSHQQNPNTWLWNAKYKKNAQFYASTVSNIELELPSIDFCLIPPVRHIKAADEALTHQLAMLEKEKKLELGTVNNVENLRTVKYELVRQNKKFYKELFDLAKSAQLDDEEPVTKMLKDMIRHQMKILLTYEKAVVGKEMQPKG